MNTQIELNRELFSDISYPHPATGWVDGIYIPRTPQTNKDATHIEVTSEWIRITSRVWKETEVTGFGVYTYENTSHLELSLPDGAYQVTLTLVNPTATPYWAYLRSNGIIKHDQVLVPALSFATVTFFSSVLYGRLRLGVFPGSTDTLTESPSDGTVYLESVTILPHVPKAPMSKPTIFLASDSTVQTYEASQYPQMGWGQVLADFFVSLTTTEYPCIGCSYPQSRLYETDSVIIENRSIGGRSARSFIEEGKLDDLLQDLKQGDYLFVQFGHNDSTKSRPNRYVHPDDFLTYIDTYIKGAKTKGATCVLVTPVARRNCDEHGDFQISFPEYREKIFEIGKEFGVPVLDLGKYSTQYLKTLCFEDSKSLYMWLKPGEFSGGAFPEDGLSDNTHLNEHGATIFANIVANLIAVYSLDHQLDTLKAIVRPSDNSLHPFTSESLS